MSDPLRPMPMSEAEVTDLVERARHNSELVKMQGRRAGVVARLKKRQRVRYKTIYDAAYRATLNLPMQRWADDGGRA